MNQSSLRIVLIFIWGAAASICSSAWATDRWFRDQVVVSANGEYRLTAKSPDNAAELPRPFQRDFRYELLHLPTAKQLWIWRPRLQAQPTVMHVHNSGVSVIWNAADELSVLDKQGNMRKLTSLSEYLPKAEYEKWVHETTAGPKWMGNSLWYFVGINDEVYFAIRTYWDRRIVVNISTKATVSQPSVELLQRCDEQEKAQVMKTLLAGAEKKFAIDDDDSFRWELQEAAFVAGKHSLLESIPLLKQYEASLKESTSSTFAGEDYRYETCKPRQIAQLSLRRLGAIPEGYPATFIKMKGFQKSWDQPWRRMGERREKFAGQLEVGWSCEQVLETIGHPDSTEDWYLKDLENDEMAWEYDMDASPPFTLRVIMNNRRVRKILRLEPVWKTMGIRDECLAN